MQDILTLNLTRAVQLSVDIAAHWLASREDILPLIQWVAYLKHWRRKKLIDRLVADRMKLSVGFRNIAVHQYERIDWNIVYAICQDHLVDFTAFAKVVLKYCLAKAILDGIQALSIRKFLVRIV